MSVFDNQVSPGGLLKLQHCSWQSALQPVCKPTYNPTAADCFDITSPQSIRPLRRPRRRFAKRDCLGRVHPTWQPALQSALQPPTEPKTQRCPFDSGTIFRRLRVPLRQRLPECHHVGGLQSPQLAPQLAPQHVQSLRLMQPRWQLPRPLPVPWHPSSRGAPADTSPRRARAHGERGRHQRAEAGRPRVPAGAPARPRRRDV